VWARGVVDAHTVNVQRKIITTLYDDDDDDDDGDWKGRHVPGHTAW